MYVLFCFDSFLFVFKRQWRSIRIFDNPIKTNNSTRGSCWVASLERLFLICIPWIKWIGFAQFEMKVGSHLNCEISSLMPEWSTEHARLYQAIMSNNRESKFFNQKRLVYCLESKLFLFIHIGVFTFNLVFTDRLIYQWEMSTYLPIVCFLHKSTNSVQSLKSLHKKSFSVEQNDVKEAPDSMFYIVTLWIWLSIPAKHNIIKSGV